MLGSGDLELGRRLAKVLGRGQIAALKGLLPEIGRAAWVVAMASAATRARRLLKSNSTEGAGNVVA